MKTCFPFHFSVWQKLTLLLAAVQGTMLFADNGPAGGKSAGLSPFIPLILIFVVFYLLVMRPQQKRSKQQQAFLTNLKRGDVVVTASGIIGTVRIVNDKIVTLEVDEGVNLKILKSQIAESAAQPRKEEAKAKLGAPVTEANK